MASFAQVVLTAVSEAKDALIISSWRPGKGLISTAAPEGTRGAPRTFVIGATPSPGRD